MNLFFLPILSLLWCPLMDTPNFYSSYSSARDASRNTQKEMLVFFTNDTCTTCTSAWRAYEKDGPATARFVSTKMNSEDFDGHVFFEKYNLVVVPAWVVLTSEGAVKEKWTGGWKDATGSPTQFIAEEPAKVVQKTNDKNLVLTGSASKAQTRPGNNIMASRTELPANPPLSNTEKPSGTTTPSTMPPKSETMVSGFVLQTGYFGSEPNAQKLITELKEKGHGMYAVKPLSQNGTPYFRVISKVYPTETDALKEQQVLSSSGVKATIKKWSEL